MSYRNPGIIRDRTADVYVQASKDLANIFIKGIEAKGAFLAAEAKSKKELDERWHGNANRNSRIINKQNKKTGDKINSIDGNLFQSYQDNVKILGGESLTAITNNDTMTDLSLEKRQANDEINIKYENYNTTSESLMGLFESELNEHYGNGDSEGLSSSAINVDWNYVGRNDGEKLTNMFIINSLNNTDAASQYGGAMSKKGGYDNKGNSNATFTTKIPINNKEFLDFQPEFKRGNKDDKEWALHKEYHGIVQENGNFIFKRTINSKNFGEGFVRKTMAGPSAEDMLIKPNILTKKGLNQAAFVTDELNANQEQTRGNINGRGFTKYNTNRYINNKFFVGESASNWDVAFTKATAIVGQNNTDDINDYIKNRLDITDPTLLMKGDVYSVDLIAKAMQMKSQRNGLMSGGYSSKKAKEKDIKYYKNLGIDILKDELIYYQESNVSSVFDSSNDDPTETDDLGYVKNRVQNLLNIEIPSDKEPFSGLESGSYKKNIEILNKNLGKKTNAMGKIAAANSQKATYNELLQKYGETNERVIDAKEVLDEINNGDSKALWIIKGDKATRVQDYDPLSKISNLEVLLEYGDQLDAKEKRYLKSEIQKIRIQKQEEFLES
tara:strand:- start:924 stop:2759 length:1836 start_codon:yes stop_codon:yes gene_type:complete